MGQVLKIVAFHPEHLGIIKARSFEEKEMMLCGDVQARGKIYQEAGPSFTGIVGDEIMACCGIIKLWQGLGELWMVSSPLVRKYPIAFYKAIQYGIESLTKTMVLNRLQCAIHIDHHVSQKWIKSLGFIYESTALSYGPDGSDYDRYYKLNMKP